MSSFGEIVSDVKDTVVEFGSNTYNEITNSQGVVSSVKNIVTDGVNKIGDLFNSGVDGIKNYRQNGFSKAKLTIPDS